MTQIDLLIVNFHTAASVHEALVRLTPWPYGRIHVIDNSVDAQEWQALIQAASPWKEVVCHASEKNIGFGAACNVGFTFSNAEFVLLLNPDALIDLASIDLMLDSMKKHSRLGALAPTVFWNRGRSFITPYSVSQSPLSEIFRAISWRWDVFARALSRLHLLSMQRMSRQPGLVQVKFLSGAVLLLRRQAILEAAQLIGPQAHGAVVFDPDYFMFFEDSDLSDRLYRAGWKLGVLPCAQAVHEYRHKASKAVLMRQARQQYFQKRFSTFYRWTEGLKLVDDFGSDSAVRRRHQDVGHVKDAAHFRELTVGDDVVAWSPSVLLYPMIFRPPQWRHSFSSQEWSMLEPGTYVALMRQTDGGTYSVQWELR